MLNVKTFQNRLFVLQKNANQKGGFCQTAVNSLCTWPLVYAKTHFITKGAGTMGLKNWFLGLMFVAVGLVSGCGSSSDNNYNTVSAEQFRLLQVGDSWTYSETSIFTPPGGGAAPVGFYYTHVVSVVKKTNPIDNKEYLALQHDFTPRTGTPAMGTEWDLFTQDASTREIKVVGNITPTGTFIQKSDTLFAGAYFLGLTHKQDWDISDNLITFTT